MAVNQDDVIDRAKTIFREINGIYHNGLLPDYNFVIVEEVPGAPAGAVAQTDGPSRTIRLRTRLWPRDEGGFSAWYIQAVLAHESIHARLFLDGNENWRSCASQDFDIWRKRIPIAR